jgi:proline iminopeptidase
MLPALLALSLLVPPADTGHLSAGRGIELFYRVLGGAHQDTIVFVHGGPGLSSSYLAKDLDFVAARHTVILYDQRGSGRSTLLTDSTQVSVALHVDDLDAVLKHFQISRANLYGHSWGGGLVAHYVAAHPERVRKAILGSSIPPRRVPYMQQFSERLYAWQDAPTRAQVVALSRARRNAKDPVAACRAYWNVFVRGYFGDTSTIHLMKSDPPDAVDNNINGWTLNPEGRYDWRPLLAHTKVPILILHGSADPIPMEAAKEWVSSIPGSRLVVLDGAGHFPMVERPKQMLAAIEAFYFR